MSDELLFNSGDLLTALRSQLARMRQAIDDYDPHQLQSAAVDVLVQQFVRIAHVEALTLDEDRIKPEQRATKVNVSGRFDYGPWHNSGPVMVDGIEVTVRVPFSGDRELLGLQPSAFNFNPPRGRVIRDEILISASGPPHDAERIKSHLERDDPISSRQFNVASEMAHAPHISFQPVHCQDRGPTPRRSRRGPASVRRPSRLVKRNLRGVTRPASRDSHAGRPRAALASARRPWPRSLTCWPLGRRRSLRPHVSPARP